MTKQDSPFEETIEEIPGGGILLHSARLVLRPCRAADSEFLHHLWTRPEVRQYLWDGRVIERSVVEALVAESRQTFQRRGFGLWLVHLRDEGMDIGFCFLKEKDEAGQAELLYGLLPEYWGKGLAFEAAQRAVRHGLEEAGLSRILAGADAANVRSLRLIERLDMILDHEEPGERDCPVKFFVAHDRI